MGGESLAAPSYTNSWTFLSAGPVGSGTGAVVCGTHLVQEIEGRETELAMPF
jgi:hypothetical protein